MNDAIRLIVSTAFLVLAGAAFLLPVGGGVAMAQADQTCNQLKQRAARQDRIRAAYQCQRGARPDSLRMDNPLWQRCERIDRFMLGKALNRRAAALERCIESALATAGRGAVGLPQISGVRDSADIRPGRDVQGDRDATTAQAPAAEDARLPGAVAQPPTAPPLTDLLGSRRQNQETAGNQVGDDRGRLREPADAQRSDRDLTFLAGLVWSYAGPISGMSCTQWLEPSDPHSWDDNYLCSERDVGFQWSFRGPIQGRGLKCIQVREKSDPHDWHDNYFCWPRDLRVTFRFSSSGRIDGFRCLAIVEPSDPHSWNDNYLCHRPEE